MWGNVFWTCLSPPPLKAPSHVWENVREGRERESVCNFYEWKYSLSTDFFFFSLWVVLVNLIGFYSSLFLHKNLWRRSLLSFCSSSGCQMCSSVISTHLWPKKRSMNCGALELSWLTIFKNGKIFFSCVCHESKKKMRRRRWRNVENFHKQEQDADCEDRTHRVIGDNENGNKKRIFLAKYNCIIIRRREMVWKVSKNECKSMSCSLFCDRSYFLKQRKKKRKKSPTDRYKGEERKVENLLMFGISGWRPKRAKVSECLSVCLSRMNESNPDLNAHFLKSPIFHFSLSLPLLIN